MVIIPMTLPRAIHEFCRICATRMMTQSATFPLFRVQIADADPVLMCDRHLAELRRNITHALAAPNA